MLKDYREITIMKESRRKTTMRLRANGKEYYAQFKNLKEATEFCHDILNHYDYIVYNFTNIKKEMRKGLLLKRERAEE